MAVSMTTSASAGSAIDETYVEALETLARGGMEVAVERLLDSELGGAPTGSDKEIEQLRRQQLALARRLAARSSESLVPVIRLHELAYATHLEQRRLPLAIHSRLHVVELIELYVATSERPDSQQLASQLLTSVGGRLQEASMVSVAIVLYERALELDRSNAAALLGLANIFERQGTYERALPYLETALARNPRHRETRLRLGINLLRLDRQSEGEVALTELVAMAEEDWILSLAYQELAHLAAERDNRGRAWSLLAEAAGRLPDDMSLAVQLAYQSERTGRHGSVDELASTLQSTAGSPRQSPRALYSRVAGQPLEDLRASLAASSERRRVPLGEALRRSGTPREKTP